MGDELTERIIGAAIEVHRHLGPGLVESIYEEALCYEFSLRGIPYERQKPVDVLYKGRTIKAQRLDVLVPASVGPRRNCRAGKPDLRGDAGRERRTEDRSRVGGPFLARCL